MAVSKHTQARAAGDHMASVFVSYAREDAPKARALASALEDASLDLWIDERIHSGTEY